MKGVPGANDNQNKKIKKDSPPLVCASLARTSLRKRASGGSEGKASARNAGDLGLIPWRRKWQPTPVLLPGESHGQRSLVGKESDTTEQLHSLEKSKLSKANLA